MKYVHGEVYDPMDPILVQDRARARRLTRLYNGTGETEIGRRLELLKELFGSLGVNIHVGENFYANFDCVILDVCEVRIGDHCLLGAGRCGSGRKSGKSDQGY